MSTLREIIANYYGRVSPELYSSIANTTCFTKDCLQLIQRYIAPARYYNRSEIVAQYEKYINVGEPPHYHYWVQIAFTCHTLPKITNIAPADLCVCKIYDDHIMTFIGDQLTFAKLDGQIISQFLFAGNPIDIFYVGRGYFLIYCPTDKTQYYLANINGIVEVPYRREFDLIVGTYLSVTPCGLVVFHNAAYDIPAGTMYPLAGAIPHYAIVDDINQHDHLACDGDYNMLSEYTSVCFRAF